MSCRDGLDPRPGSGPGRGSGPRHRARPGPVPGPALSREPGTDRTREGPGTDWNGTRPGTDAAAVSRDPSPGRQPGPGCPDCARGGADAGGGDAPHGPRERGPGPGVRPRCLSDQRPTSSPSHRRHRINAAGDGRGVSPPGRGMGKGDSTPVSPPAHPPGGGQAGIGGRHRRSAAGAAVAARGAAARGLRSERHGRRTRPAARPRARPSRRSGGRGSSCRHSPQRLAYSARRRCFKLFMCVV